MNWHRTQAYEAVPYPPDMVVEEMEVYGSRIGVIDPRFLFFIPFVSIAALLPGTRNPYFMLLGVPMRITDLVLFAMAITFILIKLVFSRSLPCSKSTKHLFLYPLLLLGLFQIISLTWSNVRGARNLMFVRTLYMCSAVIAPYLAISGLPRERRNRFVKSYSFFIAFIILIYIGLSFWFPSFRPSYAYDEGFETALGWIRVHGPLFGAATMGVVTLPIISYCLGAFLIRGANKWLWAMLAFFFIIAMVLSGSRGALVGLAFLVMLLIFTFPIKSMKFLIPMLIITITALLFWSVPERFKQLKDTARVESYKTGLRAFSSNLPTLSIGHGHGSFYIEFDPDERVTIPRISRDIIGTRETQYGFSLVNSHSTYIYTLVETGLVGFLLMIFPLMWLTLLCFSKRYRLIKTPDMIQARVSLLGIIATLPLMAVDAYIIKNYWITVVWTIFAINAAEEIKDAEYLASTAQYDYFEEDEANNYG